MRRLSCADQLACEDPRLLACLLGLGGVQLSPPGCLEYKGLGLVLDDFELCDISVEFAGVLPYQLITFPDL